MNKDDIEQLPPTESLSTLKGTGIQSAFYEYSKVEVSIPHQPTAKANSFRLLSKSYFRYQPTNLFAVPFSWLSHQPTNPLAVPFRVLKLLDNGFSRWRWGDIETEAKPTNPLAVPFRVLKLLDNGFSRWRWGGIETEAN
ncbi:MAG: hypothetical protein DRR08_32400 [Candidatus Parabeggiatoa sp. nov. 2]|nr:MAG: hypothetical protein DRR08_32400 [Gammaproteobacteria bacterium]